jgi:hypothetical protein
MRFLRKGLMKQGLRLLSDPRIAKWMQDERVMRAVMVAMSVPGKAQSFAREHLESIARAMALATEADVNDIRRTMRKFEDELSQLKGEQRMATRKRDAAE